MIKKAIKRIYAQEGANQQVQTTDAAARQALEAQQAQIQDQNTEITNLKNQVNPAPTQVAYQQAYAPKDETLRGTIENLNAVQQDLTQRLNKGAIKRLAEKALIIAKFNKNGKLIEAKAHEIIIPIKGLNLNKLASKINQVVQRDPVSLYVHYNGEEHRLVVTGARLKACRAGVEVRFSVANPSARGPGEGAHPLSRTYCK